MPEKPKYLQKIFLFCLGLSIGAAFCMKWMEADFIQSGNLFTIIGLEISYSKEQLMILLGGLSQPVKMILCYHLYFDFAFMAGVYPGIAAFCLLVRSKTGNRNTRSILLAIALLQTLAWGCDMYENYCLLTWIQSPVIGDEFRFYHPAVYLKWTIALGGVFLAFTYWVVQKIRTANK